MIESEIVASNVSLRIFRLRKQSVFHHWSCISKSIAVLSSDSARNQVRYHLMISLVFHNLHSLTLLPEGINIVEKLKRVYIEREGRDP
ncbi:hypothetical protein ISN45_Aa01g032790 [Arabidopsis thaliana x Arabidopsis arenosa]|uniref:Uncharacterized protein n=1 Tax=Arabidopsis thaliana x Arabidopsis arenosa TaxID=1240361 RepID=A0A8T2C639_9BRAS|nr:hypothetical protein ISN45_Aa01g032790 [Arabidopsis thaliana x Arabidopsis arenosa]